MQSHESSEANESYIQVVIVLILSSTGIIPYSQPLTLHEKHLGSVSAASASCFVLGCWNGRRARLLFITVLLVKPNGRNVCVLVGWTLPDLINTLSKNIKVTSTSCWHHNVVQQRLAFHKHIGDCESSRYTL